MPFLDCVTEAAAPVWGMTGRRPSAAEFARLFLSRDRQVVRACVDGKDAACVDGRSPGHCRGARRALCPDFQTSPPRVRPRLRKLGS